ncbi:hypothetical protein AOQ84DRAFT_339905 [Glonium stellatum]|uniref:FabD/lysophospholipase-like protein n=1 Tax=Glonium stellatum TaxID=574774 RepID=A0A8E2F182_9PEZI|nr:hypothetical protein AOQ84DRAFT_339905 [Glonium stellatum]
MSRNTSSETLVGCEDERCDSPSSPAVFCVDCDSRFCSRCWDYQRAHRQGKRGRDGKPHEKTDYRSAKRFEKILNPQDDPASLAKAHLADEQSKWFGWSRDGSNENQNEPALVEFDAYTNLMAGSASADAPPKYPQLVSFIGQTSAGKSTLIKMLVEHEEYRSDSGGTLKLPSPVVGSTTNDKVPTSADVHLYADPATYLGQKPILYADCEGLGAGEVDPVATTSYKFFQGESTKGLVAKYSASRTRRLEWADPRQNPLTCTRQFAVGDLYPRLLYSFSDVVVFVSKNAKTFQSTLERLLNWGSRSLEMSVNQPALPHAIIAFNATSIGVDESEWDIESATKSLLDEATYSLDPKLGVHSLIGLAEGWKGRKQIKTVHDLLKCYYSSFSVVRIPIGGRYNLLGDQLRKLHTRIRDCCENSYNAKRQGHMLLSSNAFNIYMRFAFDHFAGALNEPFNFANVSLKLNPIPQDFGGHVFRLASCIYAAKGRDIRLDLYEGLSDVIASCVLLDVVRQQRKGWTLNEDLFKEYRSSFETAFKEFCDMYWPCNFSKPDNQCVNVKTRHNSKGHQNDKGKIFASGDYESDPIFSNHNIEQWIDRISKSVQGVQVELRRRLASKPGDERVPDEVKHMWPLHQTHIQSFFEKYGSADFFSQSTCFACLIAVPEHPLPCGHVLCKQCVITHGEKLPSFEIVELKSCPLHPHETDWSENPHAIRFKPNFAGVRLLCLDGGGIRGIAELEVLRTLQMSLPDIPLQAFFDLIVGTSTGAIISLALGVKDMTVDECISEFCRLCNAAFVRRELHQVPPLGLLAAIHHGSWYKTKPLRKALQTSLGQSRLFGGQEGRHNVKVAVTATDESGRKAIVLSNYSHPGNVADNYEFLRPDSPEQEMEIWEAAAASCAAPHFFKPFTHHRTNRSYFDGAFYNNNPINIVEQERKYLWPDVADYPPDLVLSIGTGRASRISDHTRYRTTDFLPETLKISRIAFRRIDQALNADEAWNDFKRQRTLPEHDDRYVRINPEFHKVPRSDEKAQLNTLLSETKQWLEQPNWKLEINRISLRLVAGLFYFLKAGSPIAEARMHNYSCSGTIRCRFDDNQEYVRKLGNFLSKHQNNNVQPYFEIVGYADGSQGNSLSKIPLTPDVIQKMTKKGYFDLGIRKITVPNKHDQVIIFFNFSTETGVESFPISGFPRRLMSEETGIDKNMKPPQPTKTFPAAPKHSREISRMQGKGLSGHGVGSRFVQLFNNSNKSVQEPTTYPGHQVEALSVCSSEVSFPIDPRARTHSYSGEGSKRWLGRVRKGLRGIFY